MYRQMRIKDGTHALKNHLRSDKLMLKTLIICVTKASRQRFPTIWMVIESNSPLRLYVTCIYNFMLNKMSFWFLTLRGMLFKNDW